MKKKSFPSNFKIKKKIIILPLFLLTMYDSVIKNIKFFLFFLYEIFGPHGRIDR